MNKNDDAWEKIFKKYNILSMILTNGIFEISADQIREFREPRLMAKFDHKINLPKIFLENNLSILPITRGNYLIANFETYHEFESESNVIYKAELPDYIQSLDCENIFSESVALNCAFASGIIANFMEDENILPTITGRMSAGEFNFEINNVKNNEKYIVHVKNPQIEIDAAYEGIKNFAIIEAKRDISEDFLIRQIYYPYRMMYEKITKNIKLIFFVYSNGIYHLYEYKFENPEHYNSLILVKQKNYSVEDTKINSADIQEILQKIILKTEPEIPFPQADNFERIINLCELLNKKVLSKDDVTTEYDFDERQTNYYTDAARYLGLIEKKNSGNISYNLSKFGEKILSQNYKNRQLAYCECILSHKVFYFTLKKFFDSGEMPSKNEIVQIMKECDLFNVQSEETFKRRSSTIKSWLNWIVGLIND